MKHGISSTTMYSATCTCGHVERSTIRFAALELYLQDHIDESNEAAKQKNEHG